MVSLTGCKEYSLGMLNPKGLIAFQERKLFFDTLALMLIVVIPVIIMSFAFVYHYQVSHKVRDYKPNWSHSYFLETIWWTIPCIIIVVLAVLTWKKTHELDPYTKIPGFDKPPMLIQVIALPWKWLFIYPEQNIATVNYLQVPVGQQVEYWITADNVAMSAFFIPQLGSQIFAMAGMRTRLHLVANEVGTYDGLNTQYNGEGFSDMHFTVKAVTPEEMETWVNQIKQSSPSLSETNYDTLLTPSMADKPQYFSGVETNFFDSVIMTYMHTYSATHPRENSARLEKE
jgi:cytochrome o ubiquinol oxidase subunit 2